MTDRWRYVCPECGSVSLRPRTRAGGYRCEWCSEVVDNPIDKKKGSISPRGGLEESG